MAKKEKINYVEGDFFLIPLRTQGYGLGLIVRKNKDILLGYFYNKKILNEIEEIDQNYLKSKENINFIMQFGSPGLKSGTWPIIGHINNWDRTNWSIPKFLRHTEPFDPLLITYNDSLEEIDQEKLDKTKIGNYNGDGVAGYGYIEIKLTKALGA